MNKIKQLIHLILLQAVIIVIISLLGYKNITAALQNTLTIITLFYLPIGIFLILNENLNLLEKTTLLNLFGFGYASIYFILDVALKIPLTKFLFLGLSLTIIVIGTIGVYRTNIPEA